MFTKRSGVSILNACMSFSKCECRSLLLRYSDNVRRPRKDGGRGAGIGFSCGGCGYAPMVVVMIISLEQTFVSKSVPTIGVDFKVKTLTVEGKTVKLQIWYAEHPNAMPWR